ncbi:toprim domain-containing protein [Salinicoccus sp. CNSTN-B1]
MEKPVIKEVIIVEGKDDTRRLNEAVSCETIETKGSAIDEVVLKEIEVALNTRGAIILQTPITLDRKSGTLFSNASRTSKKHLSQGLRQRAGMVA